MLCCVQNWRKNDTEILSKTILKSTPNLDRFCTQLGSILGGFWRSRWSQIRSKMSSRCNLFFILFLTSFFIDFYPNLAPTWPQLGPQIHPKTHPRPILERKSEKNPTKMGFKLITFNQHEPKDPQSRPRTASCTSFSSIFDRFLMDFSYYFYWFLFDFLLFFDLMLTDAFMFFAWILEPTKLQTGNRCTNLVKTLWSCTIRFCNTMPAK